MSDELADRAALPSWSGSAFLAHQRRGFGRPHLRKSRSAADARAVSDFGVDMPPQGAQSDAGAYKFRAKITRRTTVQVSYAGSRDLRSKHLRQEDDQGELGEA